VSATETYGPVLYLAAVPCFGDFL